MAITCANCSRETIRLKFASASADKPRSTACSCCSYFALALMRFASPPNRRTEAIPRWLGQSLSDSPVRLGSEFSWLWRLSIYGAFALSLAVPAAFAPRVEAAHFAVIRPGADDDPQLSPGATWLYRPRKTNHPANPTARAKKAQAATPKGSSGARVTPLRRNRPPRETDPPKTRRPKLGW